jgi:hypothetical protein
MLMRAEEVDMVFLGYIYIYILFIGIKYAGLSWVYMLIVPALLLHVLLEVLLNY